MSDLFELDACDHLMHHIHCDVAKIPLEVPEIAGLADSDPSKKNGVGLCRGAQSCVEVCSRAISQDLIEMKEIVSVDIARFYSFY